ncbi:MAG: proteasome accessory factor PafA2 family protein, partial [Planctomycetaceae bacterium]
MIALNADFLMSTEEECLTSTPADPDVLPFALNKLFQILPHVAPSLPGPVGFFNGYGRIYVDCEHIELSMPETHSPYVLALIVERQQRVAAAARDQLAAQGYDLLLANNNHSGLLHRLSPVWGAHENYLVEQHPTSFTELILPFLVTRFYAGAGGIESPTGNFLAGVRPLCMKEVTGGGTTSDRAIHSTCREEHHMGTATTRFRYHCILGDGHRSQFNLALQFGATALALKAIFFDPKLPGQLARRGALARGRWISALQQLNVLQPSGGVLQIDPVVTQVQRIYLDSARRYVDQLSNAPHWISDLLRDWDATLSAAERLDRSWLSARLDTFAKYEFYSSILADEGMTFRELAGRPHMFSELALLDHSYHNFCDPESVFRLLEHAGLLEHRVGPSVPPGEEAEPFIPECATR